VFQILEVLGTEEINKGLLLELTKRLVLELNERLVFLELKDWLVDRLVLELKEQPVVDCQQQVGLLQWFEIFSCSSWVAWKFWYLGTCTWSLCSSLLQSKVFHTGSSTEHPCSIPIGEGGKGGPCPHGKGHRPHRLHNLLRDQVDWAPATVFTSQQVKTSTGSN
jgi:hypothetical protein